MSIATLSHAHRFVPENGAARPSPLLLLHGTGGGETDLLPLGQADVAGAPGWLEQAARGGERVRERRAPGAAAGPYDRWT